jgi:hypothetical protein
VDNKWGPLISVNSANQRFSLIHESFYYNELLAKKLYRVVDHVWGDQNLYGSRGGTTIE